MVPDRSILVQKLETLPADSRDALGIFQSDIILRTAIIAGLADLRANPKLLDYVFASLPKDALTFREYGERSIEDAKDWFLNTDIPVMMNTRVDENKVPCITITLLSSTEDFSSIGDIHYQTAEPGADMPVVYTKPFVPTSYNYKTGECIVPVDLENIFPGMVLLDGTGQRRIIREVWDDRVILDPNITTDLGRCQIISLKKTSVSLESLAFKESFQVTCHAPVEPVYLTYLHSIVVFILLRYKEELLEARGLERTTVSSGEIYLNPQFAGQIVFSRPITVFGYVRNYWPKFFKQPIEGVVVNVIPQNSVQFRVVPATSTIIDVTVSSPYVGDKLYPRYVTITGSAPPFSSVSIYKMNPAEQDVLAAVVTSDESGMWRLENVDLW